MWLWVPDRGQYEYYEKNQEQKFGDARYRVGGETEAWKDLDGMVSKKEKQVRKGLGVEKWRVL